MYEKSPIRDISFNKQVHHRGKSFTWLITSRGQYLEAFFLQVNEIIIIIIIIIIFIIIYLYELDVPRAQIFFD